MTEGIEMYETYVAVGDSFTEGLDDRRPDGGYRGWADLVAAELATRPADAVNLDGPE